MINQLFYLFLLQGIGFLFGLTFRRRLAFVFLSISALLWGCLLWVLCSMGLLVLHLPYTRLSMGIVCAIFLSSLIIWNLLRHNFDFSRAESRFLVIWSAVSLAVFWLVSQFNLTVVSPDSMAFMLNGRSFTTVGFSEHIRSELALRGVFVKALQAASPLIGMDYLYAIQPAQIIVLLALFPYLGWRMITSLNKSRPSPMILLSLLLGILSTYFIVFQTFYIHTNLLSGMYLMVALGCFWLALNERNTYWIIFGMLALSAFSLLRTEAPLFSLLFLALLFQYKEISYQTRLKITLPFATFFCIWYVYLLVGAGSESYILSPTNFLIMIAALLGFTIFIAASCLRWVQRYALPNLSGLILLGLFGLCAVMFISDAQRMFQFLRALILNVSVYGMWGVSWFVIAAGLLLAIALPSLPFERIFSAGIPAFLILLYAVSTLNVNYQLDWGDSANRMLSHIFPTCFLYLAVKLHTGLDLAGIKIFPGQEKRSFVLSALGIGIIAFTMVWIIFL